LIKVLKTASASLSSQWGAFVHLFVFQRSFYHAQVERRCSLRARMASVMSFCI